MITQLSIAQQSFQVVEDLPNEWSHNGVGRSALSTGTIRIKKDMPEDIKQGTLLHEVIHMIADMNDLRMVSENETIVSVLATGIMEVLRSNPEFARGICRL